MPLYAWIIIGVVILLLLARFIRSRQVHSERSQRGPNIEEVVYSNMPELRTALSQAASPLEKFTQVAMRSDLERWWPPVSTSVLEHAHHQLREFDRRHPQTPFLDITVKYGLFIESLSWMSQSEWSKPTDKPPRPLTQEARAKVKMHLRDALYILSDISAALSSR